MFRTQQTQNLNRLITTIGEYNNAKATGQDTAEYAKALRQTIVGQGAAAVSLGILTVIGDLLRHKLKKYRDDDDEFDVTKLFTRAGLNTLEAAGGTLWFGDELIKRLVDIASGGETKESYGISMSFITQLNGLHDAVTSFAKDRSVSSARYAAGYIAQLAGIPLNNAYSYLNSAATYIADWTGNNEYHLDDIIKIAEKNSKVSKEMEAAHEALVGMGFTKKEATDYLKGLDTSKNGKISQDEIKELYYTNPEAAGILQAIWDTNEWSKDFDTMAAAVDKERQYNSNPLYAAVDANKDKKVSQKEIVNYAMSHEDEREGLESLWNENEWSTDFEDAMDAAQNKRTKEAIKTAFENDDYNVLFETVKDYDGGEAYLAKLISKATGDRTSTNSELILGYLQKTNLSAQAFDEAVELYAAKKMVPLYTTLRNAGVPTKQALTTVYALDANSNSSISQDEFLEYYRAHPNDEALVEELWNSMGYSGKYTKDWKTYKKHNKIS